MVKAKQIGHGWLYQQDIQNFQTDHKDEIPVLRMYPTAKCEGCDKENPIRVEGMKLTSCPGCGLKFGSEKNEDPVEEPVEYKDRRVWHVAGLSTTDAEGKKVTLEKLVPVPLFCPNGHQIPEDANSCPDCGVLKSESIPREIRVGGKRILTFDDADPDGFTTRKAEEPRPTSTARSDTPTTPRLSRRQMLGLGVSTLLGAGAITAYVNTPPSLPTPHEEKTEVLETIWYYDIKVRERQADGTWGPEKVYSAAGNDRVDPIPYEPKDFPAEYDREAQKYKVDREPIYLVRFKRSGKEPYLWETSAEEYSNWKAKDKATIRVQDNGRVVGASRTGRAK